jgi:hypothetical protein
LVLAPSREEAQLVAAFPEIHGRERAVVVDFDRASDIRHENARAPVLDDPDWPAKRIVKDLQCNAAIGLGCSLYQLTAQIVRVSKVRVGDQPASTVVAELRGTGANVLIAVVRSIRDGAGACSIARYVVTELELGRRSHRGAADDRIDFPLGGK